MEYFTLRWIMISMAVLILPVVEMAPEQAIWNLTMDDLSTSGKVMVLRRSLYTNSSIDVLFECNRTVMLKIRYILGWSPCANGFLGFTEKEDAVGYNSTYKIIGRNTTTLECHDVASSMFHSSALFTKDTNIYELELDLEPISEKNVGITIRVDMKSPSGYLSAMDWPLLPFYGTMCAIYSIYGLIWMMLCFYYWRDILRVQLWIGAVIGLGLLEKAVFVAEYDSVNRTGIPVQSSVIVAEMVSCFKRSLSRMLVIIVSLGFGIVKPTLGKTLHQICGVGIVYFIFCSAEAILRTTNSKSQSSTPMMAAMIPLAITDSIICWWVFVAIVQTIQTLIVRRNAIKLALYRLFRATLMLSVFISVVFAIWSFNMFRATTCLLKWNWMWIDEAFWHMQFSALLLIIMFLWRPSANNTRYAYSPLHDVDNDDDPQDDDEITREALGDIKKVRKGKETNHKTNAVDENLKWIDENIPSVLDMALPSLLEDDEESVQRRKDEFSKME